VTGRRLLAGFVAAAVAALAVGSVAFGYFPATSASGGGGASSAASVGAGATPAVAHAAQSVTVSWTASTLSNGHAVDGYVIKRYDSGGNAQTIGSGCTGTITGLTCTETAVPVGQWQYTVTPVIGAGWHGSESAKSTVVTIAAAAISLGATSGHVGDTVSVSGSGYPASSAIAATYDGAALTLAGTSTTTASGAIPSGVTFTVPAGVAGSHTVEVTAGGERATATFTVQPQIALTPASGGAGSSGSISGTGFGAGRSLGATFNGSAVTLGGTTTTDAKGSFSGATYTVPAVAAGGYTVAVGDGAGDSASATYTVTFGPAARLSLVAASANPVAGAANNLTITAQDSAGNTVTSYTGDKSLTFGGAANAPNGTHPTVTDKGGTAVAFGTATTITFSNGVASTGGGKNGAMTLVKAGSASITVSDGSVGNSASPSTTFTNSAGVTVAFSPSCPATITKNSTTTFTLSIPNDAFGNPFTTQSSAAFGLTLTPTGSSSSGNWGFGTTTGTLTATANVTTGPASNTFKVTESGAGKTANLTATVPSGFTAPATCAVSST
jgi:hypothetical protein